MSAQCPNCHQPCPNRARFCAHCGASTGATSVVGRTITYQPTQAAGASPNFDARAIADLAQRTFGSEPCQVPTQVPPVAASQAEDLVLLLDVSSSMLEDIDAAMTKIEAAQRGSVNLVLGKARIDPNDRIAVVAFTCSAQTHLSLSAIATAKPQIIQAVQGLVASGGTDINAGLELAEAEHDWTRTDVVRRIVLLTDGQGGRPESTAKRLKQKGVVIDVIGVGPTPSKVNEPLLRAVASDIQGATRYRFIRDSQTLVAHYTALSTKTATS